MVRNQIILILIKRDTKFNTQRVTSRQPSCQPFVHPSIHPPTHTALGNSSAFVKPATFINLWSCRIKCSHSWTRPEFTVPPTRQAHWMGCGAIILGVYRCQLEVAAAPNLQLNSAYTDPRTFPFLLDTSNSFYIKLKSSLSAVFLW